MRCPCITGCSSIWTPISAALGPFRLSPKSPLFRAAARAGQAGFSLEVLTRHDAYAMVRRRANYQGWRGGEDRQLTPSAARGSRPTLQNDGTLELAQEMANHASPRTTKLYDRRGDKITQDAVERIRIE